MKNFIYLLLIGLFISSCSDSDPILDPDESGVLPNQEIDIKVNIKQNTGNIFDLFVFDLYSEKGFYMQDVIDSYDSLVWIVPNVGRFYLLHNNSFVYQWSQTFVLPSKYTSILVGYKDNKIIKADTAYITILNDKDFLGYKWKDITKSEGRLTAYADVLSSEYSLATSQSFKDSIPSVNVYLINERREEFPVFASKSKGVLSNYLSTLYAEPTYTEKQSDLLIKEYNKLFKNRLEGTSGIKPVSIWITPKSKILLYSYHEEYIGYDEYKIYAEPNLN